MNHTNAPWWLPGAALVIFGVLIVLFPELLALMVATAFAFVGSLWLAIGYIARKNQRQPNSRLYIYDRMRY